MGAFFDSFLNPQDKNYFFLPMIQGEAYSFCINFDTPISDPDFANFKLGLYTCSDDSRVIDELGTLQQSFVSAIEYNILCEFVLPSDVEDGFYFLAIYDDTDAIKCHSNGIAIGSDIAQNAYSTRVIWRNSEDTYNFSYEDNEAFYNKMRLPILCKDIQFEDEREQYRDATTKNLRNLNNYRNEIHALQSLLFDRDAHKAMSAIYNHDEIFIDGSFYVPKDAYTIDQVADSRLKNGTINAYVSKDATFEDIVPTPPSTYLLDVVTSGAVACGYSFRKIKQSYNGAVCKVRRSSDNALLDIGMVDDYIDKDAVLAFVGTGNAFVDTFYDQSGKGKNLTMPTLSNQMKIVKNGVFILNDQGFVAISGDGSLKSYMETSTITELSGNKSISVLSVYDKLLPEVYACIGDDTTLTGDSLMFRTLTQHAIISGKSDSYFAAFISKSGTVSSLAKRLWNNSLYIFLNNDTSISRVDPESTVLNLSGKATIGSNVNGGGSSYATQRLSEIVIFSEDLSETNRIIAHENQMNYYNIS